MKLNEREPIEKSVRQEVFHKFGGHCAYCGVQLGSKGWHIDHVIPFAAGGPDDIMNFFPACKHCNILKNANSLEFFRMTLENYHNRSGCIIAERLGSIKIIGPIIVKFWYEKQGYTFPEELVKAIMYRKDT